MKYFAALLLLCISSLGLAQDSSTPPQSQPVNPPGVSAPAGEHRPGTGGTITAIQDGSVTIKTLEGKTVTAQISGQTQFRKDRQPAKLSDFKVGDMVMVRGQSTGENTWQADLVATRTNAGAEFREGMGKKFIIGEIKSIDGTNIAVVRQDGVTQTISVDENTSFRKQHESITLADFKVGDHVFGRGEVKNNVFVAADLNLGDPQFMMQPGGNQPSPQH